MLVIKVLYKKMNFNLTGLLLYACTMFAFLFYLISVKTMIRDVQCKHENICIDNHNKHLLERDVKEGVAAKSELKMQ